MSLQTSQCTSTGQRALQTSCALCSRWGCWCTQHDCTVQQAERVGLLQGTLSWVRVVSKMTKTLLCGAWVSWWKGSGLLSCGLDEFKHLSIVWRFPWSMRNKLQGWCKCCSNDQICFAKSRVQYMHATQACRVVRYGLITVCTVFAKNTACYHNCHAVFYRNYSKIRYGAKLALPVQKWPQKGLSTPNFPIFAPQCAPFMCWRHTMLPRTTLRLGWGCSSLGKGPSSGLHGNLNSDAVLDSWSIICVLFINNGISK
jgi:hypothetical protein